MPLGYKYHFSLFVMYQCKILTVTGHADRQAFLEAAVLASVAIHAHNHAVFVLHAHLVVNVLLNASPEKALWTQTCKRDVMTHDAQK